MAGKILLEVVTPEHLLFSKQVDEVIAPGVDGEFGVLPGRAPFLTSLRIGELQYKMDNAWHYMSVLWGYAEVNQTKVTILAEIARRALENIDLPAAVPQQVGGKQAANRSTDDQRALFAHAVLIRTLSSIRAHSDRLR